MYPQLLLTDGAKYLVDEAGAWWLTEAIGSHIYTNSQVQRQQFQVWKLYVRQGDGPLRYPGKKEVSAKFKAALVCTDGNAQTPIVVQPIESTDFPLAKIELWAVWDAGMEAFVLMLPTEY